MIRMICQDMQPGGQIYNAEWCKTEKDVKRFINQAKEDQKNSKWSKLMVIRIPESRVLEEVQI